MVLVVGCCSLLVVLVVGLVGILGVLGVTQRLLELAVGLDMDESQEGPEQAPRGEDEGQESRGRAGRGQVGEMGNTVSASAFWEIFLPFG